MTTNSYLPETELERMAYLLLDRYEERYGPIACPPVGAYYHA